MTSKDVMTKLKSLSNPNKKDLEGMARFGINVENAWVISIPRLRNLAKEIKNEVGPEQRHQIALEIWETGVHEARILAGLIDVPKLVSEKQMESWVKDFDSWDICDQICSNLFDKTDFVYKKVTEWVEREEQFVKRAGFVLMVALSAHDKKAPDEPFIEFLEIIKEKADDPRNFVKKAVNWALRQLGKSRTKNLYNLSIKTAEEILKRFQDDESESAKAARWVAKGALSELKKDYIKNRFL